MYKNRASRGDFKPPLKRPAADDSSTESSSETPSKETVAVIRTKQARKSYPPTTTSKNIFRSIASAAVDDQKPLETKENLQTDIEELRERNRKLDEEIAGLRGKGYDESQLKLFIDKLHKYNEIKDISQILLGQLAIRERVTTKSLYPRYQLQLDD